ncbi:MAG: DUF3563 family protein [Aquincola tertiaricarbonis]|uniref:DUF3563 family protein n=1 Tax=Aquincola TaxID=391952 RepID=UPI0009FB76DC|nr:MULTISPECIES: DUF3563 family protein [Aquincola]MCR5863977.1 DUF3563 domain-containing protein [Aquincola sp. J276]
MTKIIEMLHDLMRPEPAALDEAYLAESVDIYDLERRMRELDDRRMNPQWGGLMSHGTA